MSHRTISTAKKSSKLQSDPHAAAANSHRSVDLVPAGAIAVAVAVVVYLKNVLWPWQPPMPQQASFEPEPAEASGSGKYLTNEDAIPHEEVSSQGTRPNNTDGTMSQKQLGSSYIASASSSAVDGSARADGARLAIDRQMPIGSDLPPTKSTVSDRTIFDEGSAGPYALPSTGDRELAVAESKTGKQPGVVVTPEVGEPPLVRPVCPDEPLPESDPHPGRDELAGDEDIDHGEIYGTDQNDVMTINRFPYVVNSIGGNDVITGSSNPDVIFSGAGDDIAFGNDGTDTISGGAGNDTISGGRGDDVFIEEQGSGNDVYFGGDGFDKLDLSSITEGVVIDLTKGVIIGAATGRDVIADIECVIGTEGEDTIIGGGGGHILSGGLGRDIFLFLSLPTRIDAGYQPDCIADFTKGDRISLSPFKVDLASDGTLHLFPSSPTEALFFNHGVPLALRHIERNNDAHTLLVAQVSGEGEEVVLLDLVGTHQLTSSDFVA